MDEEQRSESLLEPTDLEADIYPRLGPLLVQTWKRREGLRLVSFACPTCMKVCARRNCRFSGDGAFTAQRALARWWDNLRCVNFGHDAIMRGNDLRLRDK